MRCWFFPLILAACAANPPPPSKAPAPQLTPERRAQIEQDLQLEPQPPVATASNPRPQSDECATVKAEIEKATPAAKAAYEDRIAFEKRHCRHGNSTRAWIAPWGDRYEVPSESRAYRQCDAPAPPEISHEELYLVDLRARLENPGCRERRSPWL